MYFHILTDEMCFSYLHLKKNVNVNLNVEISCLYYMLGNVIELFYGG